MNWCLQQEEKQTAATGLFSSEQQQLSESGICSLPLSLKNKTIALSIISKIMLPFLGAQV